MIIPKEILELIEQGKWNAKPNCPLELELKTKYGWSDSIKLDNGPEFSDGGFLSIAKDISIKDLYGIYLTGDFIDPDNLNLLDGNKTLMIGWNYDEDAICLDYRFSKDSPRIMATNSSNDVIRWVEIAASIEELIVKLGIKTQIL